MLLQNLYFSLVFYIATALFMRACDNYFLFSRMDSMVPVQQQLRNCDQTSFENFEMALRARILPSASKRHFLKLFVITSFVVSNFSDAFNSL